MSDRARQNEYALAARKTHVSMSVGAGGMIGGEVRDGKLLQVKCCE